MNGATPVIIFGMSCILLTACSSPSPESAVSSRSLSSDVNFAELDQELRNAAGLAERGADVITRSGGVILVSDVDGKYWLISTLAIQTVNSGKVGIQPGYGNLAVATAYGFTPQEIADKLHEHVLRGGSPFIYNNGAGKQLSGQLVYPTEPITVDVTALWAHGRFEGWGFDYEGQPKLPQCQTGEVLDDSHIDARGNTVYYCRKLIRKR